MGRGRAKAKQTKKARDLKYSSPTMDIDALQRELAGDTLDDDDTELDDEDVDDEDDEDDEYRP